MAATGLGNSVCNSNRLIVLDITKDEKYGTDRQLTDDYMKRRMRSRCWKTKATETHSEYVILLLLNFNNGQTNTAPCYVTRTLHVLPSLSSNKRTAAHSFY
jgi:uncharacterized NAD(P)/FAD-binding protein YdhS